MQVYRFDDELQVIHMFMCSRQFHDFLLVVLQLTLCRSHPQDLGQFDLDTIQSGSY